MTHLNDGAIANNVRHGTKHIKGLLVSPSQDKASETASSKNQSPSTYLSAAGSRNAIQRKDLWIRTSTGSERGKKKSDMTPNQCLKWSIFFNQ